MTDRSPDDRRPAGREERRAAPRRSIRVGARLTCGADELDGVVENVSFGGARFVTTSVATVLAVGDRVVLAVTDATGDGVREHTWHGRVVRSERSGDEGPARVAYAIEFDDTSAVSTAEIG